MTTASALASRNTPASPADGPLPRAGNVLVVTARPGPESASTARAIQKAAAAAHQSQSPALPQLIRRLDLLDGREYLRWLVPPLQSRERRQAQ
jgi:hypothetical protein